jgi:hypothetical protein
MRPSDRECFQLVLPSEDDRFFVHLTPVDLEACVDKIVDFHPPTCILALGLPMETLGPTEVPIAFYK